MNGTELAHASPAMSGIQVSAGGSSAVLDTLKGQIYMAHEFPRHEEALAVAVKNSMQRIEVADGAVYSFPRGGKNITGPSVKLAREVCRNWPNIEYGLEIVGMDNDWVHIRGVAFDLETNSRRFAQDKFRKRIQRKDRKSGVTRWVVPDERDLRELVNRRGAICVRNALLQILPSWLIDECVAVAHKTVDQYMRKELKAAPDVLKRRMVQAYSEFGVTADMIEKRLKHPLESAGPDELTELREIYKTLADGVSKREEYFEVVAPEPTKTDAKTLDELTAASNEAAEPESALDDQADPQPTKSKKR